MFWFSYLHLCRVHFIFRFSFFVIFGYEVTKISCHFQAKTVQLIFSFFVIYEKRKWDETLTYCNFLVQKLQYFLQKFKLFFAPANMKKPPTKVAHNQPAIFFSSFTNRPKSSPNLIFCSTKMSLCATSI